MRSSNTAASILPIAATPLRRDYASLTEEKRRFFIETRGGVYFPIAGAIFWMLLGVAGFFLSERTWCVVILSAAVVATPIAIILFKKLVSHLALKSPLATLILPALLPVALSLGMAIAALYSDMSLMPLALVIGLASHWPAVGWLFGTSIFTVHAIVRVLLAAAIWFLFPEARFTWLPLSTAAVYTVTRHFGFCANYGSWDKLQGRKQRQVRIQFAPSIGLCVLLLPVCFVALVENEAHAAGPLALFISLCVVMGGMGYIRTQTILPKTIPGSFCDECSVTTTQ